MIGTKSRLALALGVVGAIALSVPSADARTAHTKRSPASVQTNARSGDVVSNPFAAQQSYRGSYNSFAAPLSGGINFNDGRNGANYNPNQ